MTFVLFFFVVLALPLLAQWLVLSTYKKYTKVQNELGVSGKEAALVILFRNGLYHIGIHHSEEEMADAYCPLEKKLYLSTNNGNSHSIASLAIAAHESGHALQDQSNFRLLRWRSALVPIVSFSGNTAFFLLIMGVLCQMPHLALMGLTAIGIVTFYQWIALPIEFNASRRAIKELTNWNLVRTNELPYVKKILRTAAGTYVAGAVVSLLQFIYFCVILIPLI